MSDLSKFYLCGGCVRDELLGIPSKDYDFVVLVSSFEEMRDEIVKNGGNIFLEKPEFQVIRAKFPGYGPSDFALPRKDGNYSDGRRPDGTEIASTLLEDSRRRDFTVNAMYKDVSTGQIIDYHRGEIDLGNKLLRTVGDPRDRFKEDYLRILRAVRFCIVKKFLPSCEIQDCFLDVELLDGLKNVSPERIREEIYKCFSHDSSLSAWWIFERYPLLGKYIFNDRTKLWLKPTSEEK